MCKVPNTHVKLCEIDNAPELNCVTWRIEIYRPINDNILIHHMYTLIDVGQLAKFGYTYWLPLASAANVAQMGV